VVNKHLPLRQKHVKRPRQPPWFSQHLLDAIKHRNKLLKKARRTKTDEDWRLYKISRNTTCYKISSAKANFLKTAINDNVNNPRIYWYHLNTLIKGKNVQQHITLQVENNELTSDPNRVAQAFNSAFVNIAQKYIDGSLQGTPDLQKLRSFVSKMKPSGERFSIPPITSCFVKEQTNSMSSTKATGLDEVPVRLLKLCVNEVADSLTSIINLSFETATFPDFW
jgi:hypothetical protein